MIGIVQFQIIYSLAYNLSVIFYIILLRLLLRR